MFWSRRGFGDDDGDGGGGEDGDDGGDNIEDNDGGGDDDDGGGDDDDGDTGEVASTLSILVTVPQRGGWRARVVLGHGTSERRVASALSAWSRYL